MNSIKMDWPLIIAALLPWAVIAVAALMTPRLTRPDIFFAVTVKPSFRQSPDGGEILRHYDRFILIAALASLLPLLAMTLPPPLMLIGLLGPTAVEMFGCFGAFLTARRRTMPFHVEPTAEREADLAPRQVSLPGNWIAQAGPFLILGVICVCIGANWDRIPPRIPIHWGVAGQPDGWAAKSPASVYASAGIGLLICLLLAGISYAILHGARRIHSSGAPARREARFVRAISSFLLGMEYWLALLLGLLSLAALRSDPRAPLPAFWPILLGQTLVIGAVFVIVWQTGQGGWRLSAASQSEHTETSNPDALPVGDRTPDECWKLGLFYVNRNDPALFVEKRFGVGWTMNMANPRCWFVIGAILLFVAATISLSLVLVSKSAR